MRLRRAPLVCMLPEGGPPITKLSSIKNDTHQKHRPSFIRPCRVRRRDGSDLRRRSSFIRVIWWRGVTDSGTLRVRRPPFHLLLREMPRNKDPSVLLYFDTTSPSLLQDSRLRPHNLIFLYRPLSVLLNFFYHAYHGAIYSRFPLFNRLLQPASARNWGVKSDRKAWGPRVSLPVPETHVWLSKVIILTPYSGPGAFFPGHGPEGWKHHKQHGGGSGASNSTKIKERQEHHGYIHLSIHPYIHQAHGKQVARRTTPWRFPPPARWRPLQCHENQGTSGISTGTRIRSTGWHDVRSHPPKPQYSQLTDPRWHISSWQEFVEAEKKRHKKSGGTKPKSAHVALATGTSKSEDLSGSTGNSTKVRLHKFKE